MNVLIQRISSGLFLKSETEWVSFKDEAQIFSNSIAALDFCLRRNIRDVGLLLTFESGSDLLLTPFDNEALGEAVSKGLEENSKLQEESRGLVATVDGIIAEGKERRKQYNFKPPNVRKPPEQTE